MNALEETLQVLYNISFAFLNFWVVLPQCDNEIIRFKLDPPILSETSCMLHGTIMQYFCHIFYLVN